MMKTQPIVYETHRSERLAYGAYFFGQGFIYTMASSYLMYFYTDYVHLPMLVISAILFVGKVWDAVNDTLFGLLVDKIRFKSGKRFLPWLNLSTVLLPLGTVLMFSVPGALPMALRVTYALATYVLWDLLYTMCDVPIFSLVTAMTGNIRERSAILTLASVGGALASGAAAIFLVPFFDRHGFLPTAVLLSAVALAAMRLICRFGKERCQVEKGAEQAVSLRDTWLYLRGNKYLLRFTAYRIISGSLYIQVLLYVCKYCLGDVKYTSLIAACAVPITLALYALAPVILRRFDKIIIYRACMLLYVAAYITLYFVGWHNRVLMTVCLLVALESAILPAILMSAIPADCVEYGTFATGVRKEGITFALQTFTSKLTAAFASVITGVLLYAIGYSGEAAFMTPAMQQGLWAGMCWAPAIGQLLALPLLFSYKLRDADVQIMADANRGRITREEAAARLSRTY